MEIHKKMNNDGLLQKAARHWLNPRLPDLSGFERVRYDLEGKEDLFDRWRVTYSSERENIFLGVDEAVQRRDAIFFREGEGLQHGRIISAGRVNRYYIDSAIHTPDVAATVREIVAGCLTRLGITDPDAHSIAMQHFAHSLWENGNQVGLEMGPAWSLGVTYIEKEFGALRFSLTPERTPDLTTKEQVRFLKSYIERTSGDNFTEIIQEQLTRNPGLRVSHLLSLRGEQISLYRTLLAAEKNWAMFEKWDTLLSAETKAAILADHPGGGKEIIAVLHAAGEAHGHKIVVSGQNDIGRADVYIDPGKVEQSKDNFIARIGALAKQRLTQILDGAREDRRVVTIDPARVMEDAIEASNISSMPSELDTWVARAVANAFRTELPVTDNMEALLTEWALQYDQVPHQVDAKVYDGEDSTTLITATRGANAFDVSFQIAYFSKR